jgi:acetyl esterase/lipase
MRRNFYFPLLIVLAVLPAFISPAEDSALVKIIPDLEYARVGDVSLKLDLYVPAGKPNPPLIVWVHGGAWRSGSKGNPPIKKLVDGGYALASVDYRLSPQAKFPAQIHDIKAAIRYLRTVSPHWNIPSDKIVIAGDSAGGHLAALVGVSNDDTNLEGTVGNDLKQSSAVQGIISFYGGSDLTTILDQSTPKGLAMRVPALELLLGGQPQDVPALARQASPVFYVNAHSPPLLLFHGDQDQQMPINQAHELCGTYEKVHAQVEFNVVHGAGHGGAAFYDAEHLVLVEAYLKRNF